MRHSYTQTMLSWEHFIGKCNPMKQEGGKWGSRANTKSGLWSCPQLITSAVDYLFSQDVFREMVLHLSSGGVREKNYPLASISNWQMFALWGVTYPHFQVAPPGPSINCWGGSIQESNCGICRINPFSWDEPHCRRESLAFPTLLSATRNLTGSTGWVLSAIWRII